MVFFSYCVNIEKINIMVLLKITKCMINASKTENFIVKMVFNDFIGIGEKNHTSGTT